MVASPPALLALGTAVPPHLASQQTIYEWVAASFADRPRTARLLRTLYAYSGIDERYTCIDDFLRTPETSRFAPGNPIEQIATTAERMQIYEREAIPVALASARNALTELAEKSGQTVAETAATITHLITISCTGFFAPGLDLTLVKELGLPNTLGRTMIGFMGCSAMFNGLRTADQIVQADPDARVLVVSVELCSLHIQPGTDRENLISASLFADGSSACVVGTPSVEMGDIFMLEHLHSEVKPGTEREMAWQIGNHGFELVLSPKIPAHLADVAPCILTNLFADQPPSFWAIHPGGPAILDGLADIFTLEERDLQASRETLAHFGNMSSATILFVLDKMRRTLTTPQTGVAMAFGPGLVIEMARLTYRPAAQPVSVDLAFAQDVNRR